VIEFWQRLERRAQVGLVVGLLLILALASSVAVWAYRTDYQVLFADLAPRDAAAMTTELDKMKVEYKLGENGTSILVPRDLVYRTRLRLMGGELPLHGAVGFEVFNNADFGMTEFVQRINYLRAVQGELTRTIQSIDGIQAARVHLAIPEQSLFKKAAGKPKASVTLTLKPGQQLSTQQINGIQRLVAASVSDVAMQDVTVLDQHGVALTRVASEEGGELNSTQLDTKRSTEDYLQKKINAVLDRTFGAGEALASVDVVIGAEHATVTTEEVLPGHGAQGQAGVIVRTRNSTQDAPALAASGSTSATERVAAAGNNNSETDYQVGRRVEQRVVPGGELKRITIAVVVKQRLGAEQLERVREIVALAGGVNRSRGDAIVVNSLDQLANPVAVVPGAQALPDTDQTSNLTPQVRTEQGARPATEKVPAVLGGLLAAALVLAGVMRLLRRRPAEPEIARLDLAARAALLADVQRWVAAPDASSIMGQER
jgi:flagellar M-ring protein FliF